MQPSITHQRGACSSVHRSTLIRGEPDISPHRQIKARLPTASHPLLPLFTHRLWCGRVCVVCEHVYVCLCACGEVVCGGEPLLPLNHGGPWGPSVTLVGAVDPLSPLTRVLPSPLLPALSPSLVALITLHVPCPFNLATKGRQAGEARD